MQSDTMSLHGINLSKPSAGDFFTAEDAKGADDNSEENEQGRVTN